MQALYCAGIGSPTQAHHNGRSLGPTLAGHRHNFFDRESDARTCNTTGTAQIVKRNLAGKGALRLGSSPVARSVPDEALVAHEEVREESVVRDVGCQVVGGMVTVVEVGHRRLVQEFVHQIVVGGDGVEHQGIS